jgi:2-iminobutanoate/2-iminopropanoate deaminase
MTKRIALATEGAPAAIGPYSQAIRAGMFIFASGSLGVDAASGEFVSESVEGQTHQALENLRVVLESAGSSLARVVKTTVFLRDMKDFGRMNGVYAEFFPEDPPARSAVQVAALPKDAAVEIEAIALA